MAETLIPLDAQTSAALFRAAQDRDQELLTDKAWLARWLFADALAARGERAEMSFYDYEGPAHLRKFFAWLQGMTVNDYFDAEVIEPLIQESVTRDRACFSRLGVGVTDAWLRQVGRYNAQDWLFQRAYPVPERQRIRVMLDFGAGHGRMANLGFAATREPLGKYIAVDAIPGTYLTQRAYLSTLLESFTDYIDVGGEAFGEGLISNDVQALHLPTWRFDLIPDASVDLVCCVQVLKELPRRLVDWVVAQFARVLKLGGALYIRDHSQFHHPNQMPIERVLAAHGFVIEYDPHIRDRSDLHGIPRIWRKFDVGVFLRQDD